MLSRQRRSYWLALILILSLVLVACERPFPGTDDTPTETVTETTDQGGDTGTVDTPTDTGTAVDNAYPGDGGDTGGTGDTGTGGDTGDTGGDTGYPGDGGDTGGTGETGDIGGDPGTGDGEAGGGVPGDGSGDTGDTGGDTGDTGGDTGDAGGGTGDTGGDTGSTGDTGDAGSTGTAGTEPIFHTVSAGENLYRIGLRYNVSYLEIARLNNLVPPYVIKVGDRLQITGTTEPPTPPPATTTYVVKPGDNLFRIGLAFGINWRQIAEANGIINPNTIYVGQVLKIPQSTPGPGPEFSHTVQYGETLYLISLRYGISWVSIAERNEISSPYVIYAGETLIIPSK